MHVSYFYDVALPTPLAAPLQILSTCRALSAQGAEVTVYTGPLQAADAAEALRFYGLPPHEWLQVRPFFRPRQRLTSALRPVLAEQADAERHIVLSRGETGVKVLLGARRIQRAPGERRVLECHRLCWEWAAAQPGMLRPLRAARVRARERAALAEADGIVCLTEGVREGLERSFGPLRVPVLLLPSGTALPQEEPPDDAARDIDIFYAGKIERRKGVYDLVEALRFLPEYRACIVGGSSAEVNALRRHAEVVGVAGRVALTGYVPPAEVDAFYRRARVGVCPLPVGESAISERYTSPLKVLKMMGHGVPVVGTDVPALREMIEPEVTGLLPPPSQPRALAAAVRALLEDRPRAHRLAEAARQRVQTYSWERRAEKLRAFLEALP